MTINPTDLQTPEQGHTRTTRARPISRPDRPDADPSEDLARLRRRLLELTRPDAALDLPGARDHCADCFSRGVKAAIAALEDA